MCKIYIYYIYLCLNELYYKSECVVYAFCLNKTIYYILYYVIVIYVAADMNYK